MLTALSIPVFCCTCANRYQKSSGTLRTVNATHQAPIPIMQLKAFLQAQKTMEVLLLQKGGLLFIVATRNGCLKAFHKRTGKLQ